MTVVKGGMIILVSFLLISILLMVYSVSKAPATDEDENLITTESYQQELDFGYEKMSSKSEKRAGRAA